MTDGGFTSPLAPAAPTPGFDPSAPFDPNAPFDAVAALRDIHLPARVGLWPLAPGWWMLAGLLLVLGLVAALLEWRRRQTLSYQACRMLDAIARDTARYSDARAVAAASASLMRRVLVSRAGRPQAAALSGDDWESALAEGRAGLAPELAAFIAAAPYLPPGLPDADRLDRARVVAGVRRWIRGHA